MSNSPTSPISPDFTIECKNCECCKGHIKKCSCNGNGSLNNKCNKCSSTVKEGAHVLNRRPKANTASRGSSDQSSSNSSNPPSSSTINSIPSDNKINTNNSNTNTNTNTNTKSNSNTHNNNNTSKISSGNYYPTSTAPSSGHYYNPNSSSSPRSGGSGSPRSGGGSSPRSSRSSDYEYEGTDKGDSFANFTLENQWFPASMNCLCCQGYAHRCLCVKEKKNRKCTECEKPVTKPKSSLSTAAKEFTPGSTLNTTAKEFIPGGMKKVDLPPQTVFSVDRLAGGIHNLNLGPGSDIAPNSGNIYPGKGGGAVVGDWSNIDPNFVPCSCCNSVDSPPCPCVLKNGMFCCRFCYVTEEYFDENVDGYYDEDEVLDYEDDEIEDDLDDFYEEDDEDEFGDEWFPASRDCECCKGHKKACKCVKQQAKSQCTYCTK